MTATAEKSLSVDEFMAKITKLRRTNKGKWFAMHCTVENCTVRIDVFNTYIRKLMVDNIDHTPAMTNTVKAFNATIVQAIQYAQANKG